MLVLNATTFKDFQGLGKLCIDVCEMDIIKDIHYKVFTVLSCIIFGSMNMALCDF